MTLTEINTQFKAVTDAIAGLNGYSFGWASDRTRSQTYDAPGEDQTSLYPRVLWAVPTLEQDVINRNDVYRCEVFFDDLLGYDDTGETDFSTQVEKWDLLMQYATRWTKEMQNYRTTGHIEGQVAYTLDSFGGTQRLISVIASFNFVTKSIC
jgi:hypothetical protein